MDPSSPYWHLSWEDQPDDTQPTFISRFAPPDNSNAYFGLLLFLPLEIQILIWQHAAASRFAQSWKYNPLDYHLYYSGEKSCRVAHNHYASRLLSRDTDTKIWIANKLLRELKGTGRNGSNGGNGREFVKGAGFYGLMATSKLARRSALEFWKQSVQEHDVYRDTYFWNMTDVQIEGAKQRAEVSKARLVRVLDEMLGLMRMDSPSLSIREGWT